MPKLSSDLFSNVEGTVSDIFAGIGAQQKGEIEAQGMRITAQGTLITAQGTRLNAQGTRLNAESLRTKAAGDIAEASNYDLASQLANANAAYTEQSTRIQQAQLNRQIFQTEGAQQAEGAASGFSSGGSAGDLLRSSAQQGALAKGVLAQQGIITEAGYTEQAQSYTTLANAGRATAAAEQDMANKTDVIALGEENIATQQENIAGQQMQLASKEQQAADTQATGDFIGAALKGAAAVAMVL